MPINSPLNIGWDTKIMRLLFSLFGFVRLRRFARFTLDQPKIMSSVTISCRFDYDSESGFDLNIRIQASRIQILFNQPLILYVHVCCLLGLESVDSYSNSGQGPFHF